MSMLSESFKKAQAVAEEKNRDVLKLLELHPNFKKDVLNIRKTFQIPMGCFSDLEEMFGWLDTLSTQQQIDYFKTVRDLRLRYGLPRVFKESIEHYVTYDNFKDCVVSNLVVRNNPNDPESLFVEIRGPVSKNEWRTFHSFIEAHRKSWWKHYKLPRWGKNSVAKEIDRDIKILRESRRKEDTGASDRDLVAIVFPHKDYGQWPTPSDDQRTVQKIRQARLRLERRIYRLFPRDTFGSQ